MYLDKFSGMKYFTSWTKPQSIKNIRWSYLKNSTYSSTTFFRNNLQSSCQIYVEFVASFLPASYFFQSFWKKNTKTFCLNSVSKKFIDFLKTFNSFTNHQFSTCVFT